MSIVPAGNLASRVHHLDGIRGVASLIVVFCHFFWELLGAKFPVVRSPVVSIFQDGGFAVYVFFILSGDALAYPFFRSGANFSISRIAVKRYFRLTIPILMSCFVVYLIMKLKMDHHMAAVSIVGQEGWLGKMLPFEPSLPGLMKYALRDVYQHHTRDNSYNPFLWTMSVEMIGSLIVFVVLYAWRDFVKPAYLLAAAGLYLFMMGSLFSLFLAGVGFAYGRVQGTMNRFHSPKWQWAALTCIVIAMVVRVVARELAKDEVSQHVGMLCALVLVAGLHVHIGAQRFFAVAPMRWLGKISFPLYLIHFSVMISFASAMVVRLDGAGQFDLVHALPLAWACVLMSLALAAVFELLESSLMRRVDAILKRVFRTPLR